ncbi:hypothetical protein GQ600_21865 [Phytophthora cactorum]|nr:hypothetical protein GQ600_21865 [Phytophthora cactorum]
MQVVRVGVDATDWKHQRAGRGGGPSPRTLRTARLADLYLVLEVADGVGLLGLAVLHRRSLPLSRRGLGLAGHSTAEVRACQQQMEQLVLQD